MLKLKCIISIFFVLAIQQVYAASSDEHNYSFDEDFKIESSFEPNESSFEANDSFPGIWGDVPAGRIGINCTIRLVECDPGFSKSKDVLSGLIFSVTKNHLKFLIARSSIFTRYSAVYIPIYLQTASFLL